MTLVFIAYNRNLISFEVSDLLILLIGVIFKLLLFITTPLFIAFELCFNFIYRDRKIKTKNHRPSAML